MTDQNTDPSLAAAAVSSEEAADLFDPLVRISQGALARGRFSTTYHALAAALHWAQADVDEQRPLVVAELGVTSRNGKNHPLRRVDLYDSSGPVSENEENDPNPTLGTPPSRRR